MRHIAPTAQARRPRVLPLLAALAVALSACTTGTVDDSAVETPDTPGATAPASETDANDNTDALLAVYAAVEGLTGEQREAKLLELAAEEDGLNIYSGMNSDDLLPLVEAFNDQYGIEPNYFTFSTGTLPRIQQELDAGYAGNDVLMTGGDSIGLLARDGVLAPLQSPATADITSSVVHETWVGIYLLSYIAGWNTNAVTDPPATWEELLVDFPGRLALELDDWSWFATLVQDHFVGELGWTQDEAIELFRTAAREASVVDGHTTMAEFLVAGEYDAAASLFHHRVTEMIDDGAPIEWEPPILPIVVAPVGIAIMRHVANPATALLWTEFMLTDGQLILADNGRSPSSTIVPGGVPAEYDPISIDLQVLLDDSEKWIELWGDIISTSGQPPLE